MYRLEGNEASPVSDQRGLDQAVGGRVDCPEPGAGVSLDDGSIVRRAKRARGEEDVQGIDRSMVPMHVS